MKTYKSIDTAIGVPATDVMQNIRVLFADESKETIAVFKAIVKRMGWKGTYARNAVELIDEANKLLIEGETVDAVVLDVNYYNGPNVTGITAAREIRKAMPDVPILFITSYVTSIIKEEVRRVGAEIHQKPFNPEQLFVRLSQLIYWHRLAMSPAYDGIDRRKMSVNLGSYRRRVTDKVLSTPVRIQQTIKTLKEGL